MSFLPLLALGLISGYLALLLICFGAVSIQLLALGLVSGYLALLLICLGAVSRPTAHKFGLWKLCDSSLERANDDRSGGIMARPWRGLSRARLDTSAVGAVEEADTHAVDFLERVAVLNGPGHGGGAPVVEVVVVWVDGVVVPADLGPVEA